MTSCLGHEPQQLRRDRHHDPFADRRPSTAPLDIIGRIIHQELTLALLIAQLLAAMIFRVLLLSMLSRFGSSLSLASIKEFQRQAQGGIIVAVMTALPLSAQGVEVVKIDADMPALIQLAKENKDVVLQLAKRASSAVTISQLPSNWVEFARDAAAGDAFVEINGVPVDFSLLSEKGAVDVGISTEQGDFSFTVTSKLLPKLPFLSKRVVPVSEAVDATGVRTTAVVTRAAAALQAESTPKQVSLPMLPNPLQQGWTTTQLISSAALGLGASYVASYAYYIKSAEDEEREAMEKKQAAALKKTQEVKVAPPTDAAKKVTTKPAAAVEEREYMAEKPAETTPKSAMEQVAAEQPVENLDFSIESLSELKPVARFEKKKSIWKFWEKK
jgi:hypothetical protein